MNINYQFTTNLPKVIFFYPNLILEKFILHPHTVHSIKKNYTKLPNIYSTIANQQGFSSTTTRVQNFIKILYLLLTIFEQSTKITHSRLFIPNLTLEKIFPRTKLFRPELNRKKKVPLAFQIKKKITTRLPNIFHIYTKTLATTTRIATQQNFTKFPIYHDPCTKYQNYTSLPTPCDLTLEQRTSLPAPLSYPCCETLARNPPRTEIFRRTITRPVLASRQPSTA